VAVATAQPRPANGSVDDMLAWATALAIAFPSVMGMNSSPIHAKIPSPE
jgi:hypothetical protein